jgi:hypothetical protein
MKIEIYQKRKKKELCHGYLLELCVEIWWSFRFFFHFWSFFNQKGMFDIILIILIVFFKWWNFAKKLWNQLPKTQVDGLMTWWWNGQNIFIVGWHPHKMVSWLVINKGPRVGYFSKVWNWLRIG